MSDAVSPHGFTVTRRGYDPAQVEHALNRLTGDRDLAWQRLSGLGNRMRALEQQLIDAAAAAKAAEEAGPPAFTQLSDRAARMLDLAVEEAEQLRADAEEWIDALDHRIRTEAQQFRAEVEQHATRLRTSADEAHRRELERARAQAEAERGAADRDVRLEGEESEQYAAEVRARVEKIEQATTAWLAEQQHAADQERIAAEQRAVAWEDDVTAGAERKLSEAERHRKAMQAKAAEIDAEAATQAQRIIEAAQREAERIAEAAAREQAAHAERRDALQAHLDHIRATLTTLTAVPDDEQAPEPEPGPEPEPVSDGSGASESPTTQLPLAVEEAAVEEVEVASDEA